MQWIISCDERNEHLKDRVGNLHSNIPLDQIIKTKINRFFKSVGGLVGKTVDKDEIDKWTRLNAYLCSERIFR